MGCQDGNPVRNLLGHPDSLFGKPLSNGLPDVPGFEPSPLRSPPKLLQNIQKVDKILILNSITEKQQYLL